DDLGRRDRRLDRGLGLGGDRRRGRRRRRRRDLRGRGGRTRGLDGRRRAPQRPDREGSGDRHQRAAHDLPAPGLLAAPPGAVGLDRGEVLGGRRGGPLGAVAAGGRAVRLGHQRRLRRLGRSTLDGGGRLLALRGGRERLAQILGDGAARGRGLALLLGALP